VLTEAEAVEWAEGRLKAEVIEQHFGALIKD
jgi:hypothetical protein